MTTFGLFSLLLSVFCSLNLVFCGRSITMTWSTPETNDTIPINTLKAINTHLHALQLANTLPLLLRSVIQIKLCPPQNFDPLVKEFTVPRLSGYAMLYDHECIQRGMEGVEIKWGGKPKKPVTPPSPPEHFYGKKGLTVPAFIYELFKYTRNPTSAPDSTQIWLLDSDSLRAWYTAPILNYIYRSQSNSKMIPSADLMRQVNAMYGSLGEKDLKNMPQAVQGALLIVLPDYSAWSTEFSTKSLFDPTWWSTRLVPKSRSEIVKYSKEIIEKRRKSDQLVIIHHEPTPFNFDIISHLTGIYGEKAVISSTRVLPKTFTTVQLLQFIQKAAGLVVDSRDPLGRLGLLTTGFTDRVALVQSHLPCTTVEYVLYISLAIWFLAIAFTRAFLTHKHYLVPLHIHTKRFIFFAILAMTPIYSLNPVFWPEQLTMIIFSLFEAGFGLALYIIVGFYATAGLMTGILVAVKQCKKSKNSITDEEHVSDTISSVTETIQLIPK